MVLPPVYHPDSQEPRTLEVGLLEPLTPRWYLSAPVPFLILIIQAWGFLQLLLISHRLIHKNVIRTLSQRQNLWDPASGRTLPSHHTEHPGWPRNSPLSHIIV